MQILIDTDACPVIQITEQVAKEFSIPITLLCDTNHIHQSGRWYTDENMDRILMERHLSQKARRASAKNHLKGPSKRTAEDDLRYEQSLRS